MIIFIICLLNCVFRDKKYMHLGQEYNAIFISRYLPSLPMIFQTNEIWESNLIIMYYKFTFCNVSWNFWLHSSTGVKKLTNVNYYVTLESSCSILNIPTYEAISDVFFLYVCFFMHMCGVWGVNIIPTHVIIYILLCTLDNY